MGEALPAVRSVTTQRRDGWPRERPAVLRCSQPHAVDFSTCAGNTKMLA